MSLSVRIAEEKDMTVWNDVIENSANGTIFHKWEWLKIVAKYSNNIFYPFLIYNGIHPSGILPMFMDKKGFFNVALSPPPHSNLLYLGPVIKNYDELKQHKKEELFIEFQEIIDKLLFSDYNVKYTRILSAPGIFDSRPYRWTGYDVEPLYTYRVNLKRSINDVWSGFDKKLRVKIKNAEKEGVIIEEGNEDDIVSILNLLRQRYIEQGYKPSDNRNYLLELYSQFKDTNLKIFVARYNDETVGGMISPYYKEKLYLWVGVPKSTLEGISVNDLVQWEAIKWAHKNNFSYYEIMDSGREKRLRYFKSKYNPELHIWYSATKFSSPQYKLAKLFKKSL